MTQADAYRQRKQIISRINDELEGSGYAAKLEHSYYVPTKERGIATGCGYMEITKDGNHPVYAIFDCFKDEEHERFRWCVGSVHFDFAWDSQEMASVLVGKHVLSSKRIAQRDQIDFDLLYQMKTRNRGIVTSFTETDQMISMIDEVLPLSEDDKGNLRKLIEWEKNHCRKVRLGTRAYMHIEQLTPTGQNLIHFAVCCEAMKTNGPRYNWHLHETSQWLYAGGIVIQRNREGKINISSHH